MTNRCVPHRRTRLTSLLVSLGVACATLDAAAQTPSGDRVADLEQRLQRSLQLIESLSRRVQELESRGAAAAPAPAPAAAQAPNADARIADLERQVQQMASGTGRSATDNGVPLHGFADVGLATRTTGLPKGANLGLLDFYLTPSFGDRVKTLVELVFEVDGEGAIATDLERLQVGYTFSDALTGWVGRFHTPYGYWNTAYHHGAQIQTSILRPRFLDFEDKGGILPAHTVGFWGTGTHRVGTGRVTYDLFAGNSPRFDNGSSAVGGAVLNPNLATSTNHNASAGFNVGYEFGGALDGLKVGAHGMQYRVRDDSLAPASSADVRFVGGYGLYLENNWEVLGEYYAFSNTDDASSGRRRSNAWYAQAGYNVRSWTPYVRLERTVLDQADFYFANQESGASYRRGVVGLRYDVNRRAAVKAEFNRTTFWDRDIANYNEARVQFAVRF